MMLNEKIITVTIKKDGSTDIDLSGFNGKGCSQVASDFVGSDKVTSENLKPEFEEEAFQQQSRRVHQ